MLCRLDLHCIYYDHVPRPCIWQRFWEGAQALTAYAWQMYAELGVTVVAAGPPPGQPAPWMHTDDLLQRLLRAPARRMSGASWFVPLVVGEAFWGLVTRTSNTFIDSTTSMLLSKRC